MTDTLLPYYVFCDKNWLFKYDTLLENINDNSIEYETNTLKEALIEHDFENAKAIIKHTLDLCCKNGFNYRYLKRMCLDFDNCIWIYCNHSQIMSNYYLFKGSVCHTIEDIYCFYCSFLNYLKSCEGNKYSKKIRLAVDFIHSNYQKEISLEDLAMHTNISSIYLSKLFKSEVGVNFSNYLTNYRLEVSKSMLLSNKYKVYEIAELVGFKSSQYFSFVFKKYTGVKPSNFEMDDSK